MNSTPATPNSSSPATPPSRSENSDLNKTKPKAGSNKPAHSAWSATPAPFPSAPLSAFSPQPFFLSSHIAVGPSDRSTPSAASEYRNIPTFFRQVVTPLAAGRKSPARKPLPSLHSIASKISPTFARPPSSRRTPLAHSREPARGFSSLSDRSYRSYQSDPSSPPLRHRPNTRPPPPRHLDLLLASSSLCRAVFPNQKSKFKNQKFRVIARAPPIPTPHSALRTPNSALPSRPLCYLFLRNQKSKIKNQKFFHS
jgi:hypothetical protein